jgi:hypothetical protein
MGHGRPMVAGFRTRLNAGVNGVERRDPVADKLRATRSGDDARMNRMMKRVLAGCIAAVTAATVSAALGSPAIAGPCERTVGIQPQVSAGESAGWLTFAVYSTGCAAAGVVAFRVVPGTARATGTMADFRAEAGYLRWESGDTAGRLIAVSLIADIDAEAPIEDFAVVLTEPTPGLRLGRPTGQGRILDDDVDFLVATDDVDCPPVTPNLPMEVHGGSIMCDDFLLVNRPSTAPVTVRWSTQDGTAVAGVDFVAETDQKLVLPAGQTQIRIPIRYLRRPSDTPSRWFSVQLTASSSGTIVDPVSVITLGGP